MTRILHLLSASELVIWYAMSSSFPHGCDPRERNLAVQMILGLADDWTLGDVVKAGIAIGGGM